MSLWLKNGDKGSDHFAIKYELDGREALFYPDFLVTTINGGIRIYGTKGDDDSDLSTGNAADAVAKARALAAYVADLRARAIDVEGGIVIQKKNGAWWVHPGDCNVGNKDPSEGSGWRHFDV